MASLTQTVLFLPFSDRTDRVTSTYAQGARPKETSYSPSSSSSSSSSTARESSLNRHLSSSNGTPPQLRNFSNRTATRFLNGSSTFTSSQEPAEGPESSSDASSAHSSHTPWYTAPLSRPEPTLPRPTPEGAEQEGRRSTRRLLSRLFSRRSSQDSSSGSSSVRSVDEDSPSTGGESVDSDEGARVSSVDPDTGRSTMGSIRNNRADLGSIQESSHGDYHSGLPRPRMASWREPGVGSSGGGSGSSWLSSSFRGRCPPLLSRLRRHARDESPQSPVGSEEGYRHLLRRWDDLEHKTSQDDGGDDDDEEDEDDDEQEEGAVGLEAFGAGRTCRIEDETLPDLEDTSVEFSPRRRVRVYGENISISVGPLSGAESQPDDQKEKTISSRDQEKLRKLKER